MEEKKTSSVSDVGAWAMNIFSSIGIIMANKQLMSPSGFGFVYATTLTGLHFTMTAMVGMVSNASGYSSATKHVPNWELIWFSVVANVSITTMNLSLMLNSVGFYQISKLSMIPVVCIMEWILHGKQYSKQVKMAVGVVVIGVGVCTVTDVKINAKGFLSASIGVLSSSLQQISIGALQKKYSIGSFELLSKTAPIQAFLLLLTGPFVDYCLTGKLVTNYSLSANALLFIILSCTLAVFCNLSQYLCIGRFSATSFQVLGHMKTICILVLGWLLFDSQLTLKNISGMAVAVVGMVIYSWAIELEKKQQQQSKSNKIIDSLPTSKPTLSDEQTSFLEHQIMDHSSLMKDLEMSG